MCAALCHISRNFPISAWWTGEPALSPIQPVFVHKLICQGTVEERIHQLQAKKSQLADSLLSDAARAAAPDESTLSALLAPLG